MAIDINKLNAKLPDQITFSLTSKVVRRTISISLEKWSQMGHGDRHRFITDWATEQLLDAATVASSVGYAPTAETRKEVMGTYVTPRPIKDNPQV